MSDRLKGLTDLGSDMYTKAHAESDQLTGDADTQGEDYEDVMLAAYEGRVDVLLDELADTL